MEYVLASASPRRKELLAQILSKFEVIPSEADEKVNISLFPEQTIVVFGSEILGKPRDKADAVKTLKMLSGKTHYVITGVCVRNKFKKSVDFDRTEVKFNILTDEFIESYVNGGSPMDKAGSYGIQDGGIVKEYFGSYTNVVGLPVMLTKKLIEEVISDL